MSKLFKLLFLVAHGAFDEHGRIVGIVAKPRLNLRFRVYLFGVASTDIYRIVEKLAEKGILRLEDVDTYVPNAGAEELYRAAADELRRRSLELARIVEAVSTYAGMEPRELEGFVQQPPRPNRPGNQSNILRSRCRQAGRDLEEGWRTP